MKRASRKEAQEDDHPKRPRDQNKFGDARTQLQLSAQPAKLPCRETEHANILEFVRQQLQRGGGSSLYISGTPGTGKTATVMGVIQELKKMSQTKGSGVPAFHFVAINAMKLRNPHEAYPVFCKQLLDRTASVARALSLLDAHFSNKKPKTPCVALVDELDFLHTKNQSVIYNLFDWPTRHSSHLIVIGIANTMDLPERLMPRIASRLGSRRMIFQQYTRFQLQAIIKDRVSALNIIHPEAIEICTMRMASFGGDARRALAICRRATELAEARGAKEVGEDDVIAASKEALDSSRVAALQSLTLQERILLGSVVRLLRRSGKTETILRDIVVEHQEGAQTIFNTPLPNASTVSLILARLAGFHLLHAEGCRADLYQRVLLKVSDDDLRAAFAEDTTFMDYCWNAPLVP